VSVDAVIARVAQLQSLMGATVPPPPAQPQAQPAATNFAATLADASAGAAPNAAASAVTDPTATTLAPTGPSSLPSGTPYAAEITAAAQRNGLDPALLAGLIKQESGFNPNAGSPAGAQGLTQLMPGTARGLGVTNLHDPAQSIEGGARYLAEQLKTFHGDVARGLAAYNAGPGAVQRYGGVPPYAETQNYVRVVQANAAAYRGRAAGSPFNHSTT
jgi:soluble lytic murein transglycosylase-like protein